MILRTWFSLLLLAAAAVAADVEIELKGDGKWKDTGVTVAPGDVVTVEASGSLQYSQATEPATPNGLARGWKDLLRVLPFNEAGRGALLGRVGDHAASRPFLLGERKETRAPVAGKLYIATNNKENDPGEGSYQVRISKKSGEAPAGAVYKGPLPTLTQEQLDSIPRRVRGLDETPGDRTNFILFGSEERVKEALAAAGWVIVDRTVQETVLKGLLVTLSKGAYVTIPMSELYLFDRPQDYGYAQADPLMVVAARHHFRIWKAPFQVDGWTVWVGAGTHDVGFDKDQRDGKLTHKIDPETDKERDYIGDSLAHTGLVVKRDYMTPKDPIKSAKTAHGQEFMSDGRTLLIWLAPGSAAAKEPVVER